MLSPPHSFRPHHHLYQTDTLSLPKQNQVEKKFHFYNADLFIQRLLSPSPHKMKTTILSFIFATATTVLAAPAIIPAPQVVYQYETPTPPYNSPTPLRTPTTRIYSHHEDMSASIVSIPAATPSSFAAIASRSGSRIHLETVNARDQGFWLGRQTSSDCATNKAWCAPGNETTFNGGDDTLSMSVQVPGGQHVYIAPGGALGFTQPHSPLAPRGSLMTGFKKTRGRLFGGLSCGAGFYACPEDSRKRTWQVYVNANGFVRNDCLSFDVLTVNTTGVGAWEYM